MAMAAPAEEEDHSAAEEEEDNTTNPTEAMDSTTATTATGVTKEEPSTRIFLVTIDIGTLQRNWNENKEKKIRAGNLSHVRVVPHTQQSLKQHG